MNGTVTAFIGLGSNLGDRAANLASARHALRELGEVSAESPAYETAPWGVDREQPRYLNQVARLETALEPADLLRRLLEIETELGRERQRPGQARVIDLDLLLYGRRVIDEPGLTVPHPRMHLRAFVLAPLADIAPELMHPVLGKTVADLLAGLEVRGVEKWRQEQAGHE